MYHKWLEAFHYVVSEGSFTGAAKRLNVGQPTISTHVSNLEKHFRIELLHRKGRSIQLTDAGENLFAITEDMFGHAQEAVEYLTNLRKLESGELRFGAVRPYDVMELIVALKEHRPGIKCSVEQGSSEKVIEDLNAFRSDIGIVSRSIKDRKLHSVFYRHHQVFVVVNVQHRLANRNRIRMEELNGEGMIVRNASSTTQDAFDRAAREAGISVTPTFEIESREGVREAVIRNLGIGVISETVFAPHPDIRPLIVEDAEILTDAYIVCLAARKNRPPIRDCLVVAQSLIDRQVS